jgi:hypothetical protein
VPRILHVLEHAYLSGSGYLCRGQHVHWNCDLFSDEHMHQCCHMRRQYHLRVGFDLRRRTDLSRLSDLLW